MNNFNVRTDHFQGPLDKLLELVRDNKLDINLISLSRVTEDFLKHVSNLQKDSNVPHRMIADFLVIASTLLLIKSKEMIPSFELEEEEEEDILKLEIQLKIYNKIKEAKTMFEDFWSEVPKSLSRDFSMPADRMFYPPRKISPMDLLEAMQYIVSDIEKLRPKEVVKDKTINLQKTIKRVLNSLQGKSIKLNDLSESRTRHESVVLFLAILHLFRDQLIEIDQKNHFSDIEINSKSF